MVSPSEEKDISNPSIPSRLIQLIPAGLVPQQLTLREQRDQAATRRGITRQSLIKVHCRILNSREDSDYVQQLEVHPLAGSWNAVRVHRQRRDDRRHASGHFASSMGSLVSGRIQTLCFHSSLQRAPDHFKAQEPTVLPLRISAAAIALPMPRSSRVHSPLSSFRALIRD